MKQNIKNIIIGAIIGVVAISVIGAGNQDQSTGRFQGCTGSGFVVIVDTQTGKAWCANPASQNFTGTHPGFWERKDN